MTFLWDAGGGVSFPEGRMVMAGGDTLNSGNDTFDAANDNWTSRDDSVGGFELTASAIYDGDLYVMTGETGGDSTSTLHAKYDLGTDAWDTSLTACPTGRVTAQGVGTGTYNYIHGGYDGSSFLFAFERYDPVTDTWDTSVADAPVNYHEAAMAYDGDNQILLCGGDDSLDDSQYETYLYDVSANSWSSSPANMPARKSRHEAVAVNGKAYIHGGSDLFEYDFATDTWTTLASSNYSYSRHGMGALKGGTGVCVYSQYQTEVYEISSDSWTVKNDPGTNRDIRGPGSGRVAP